MKWVPDTTTYDETFDRTAAARAHYRPLVATLESFTQAALVLVDVVDEEVQGPHALDEPGLDLVPLPGRNDPGHEVEREDALDAVLLAIHGEGDALVHQRELLQALAAVDLGLGEGLQRGHQWPVVRPGGGRAIERLVVGGGVGHPLHGRP